MTPPIMMPRRRDRQARTLTVSFIQYGEGVPPMFTFREHEPGNGFRVVERR